MPETVRSIILHNVDAKEARRQVRAMYPGAKIYYMRRNRLKGTTYVSFTHH